MRAAVQSQRIFSQLIQTFVGSDKRILAYLLVYFISEGAFASDGSDDAARSLYGAVRTLFDAKSSACDGALPFNATHPNDRETLPFEKRAE